jgi:RNA polymerase sigma factor (sigma-70 family)
MAARPAVQTDIGFYEGLVRKTAAIIAPYVQEDYEDIVSILRIKVWRALEAFDSTRSAMPVERYVFSCVANQKKDLLKRRRRHEVSFDDLADAATYEPSVTADSVYAEVEAELPVIPCTLTQLERAVILRLYTDCSQRETAVLLGLSRAEMERTVKGIRTKMADWRPGHGDPVQSLLAAA